MNYFLDTEFNEHRGSLLSMAVVREDGKAMYFEIDLPAGEPLGPWVKEHVVPKMSGRSMPLEQAQDLLQSFFAGDATPRIYCDWPTDIEWLCWAMDLGGGKRILGRHIELVIAPDLVSSDASEVPHHALADAVAMCKQFLAAKADPQENSHGR